MPGIRSQLQFERESNNPPGKNATHAPFVGTIVPRQGTRRFAPPSLVLLTGGDDREWDEQFMPEPAHFECVVFFAHGFGDSILTLPALRALAHVFPRRSALICERDVFELLFWELKFPATFEVNIEVKDGVQWFDARVISQHVASCDLFVSLTPWHTPSVDQLIEALRPEKSIGFSPAFSEQLPLHTDEHSIDLAFSVPRYVDPTLRLDDFLHAPKLTPRATSSVTSLAIPVGPSTHLLTIHGDSKPDKMWPGASWSRFLNVFLASHPTYIALLVGLRDINIRSQMFPDRVFSYLGLPLSDTLALLAASDMFCGIDSVMLHAADLFRVPGVGLFGPTNPRVFGFRVAPHNHVWNTRGINHITVEDVCSACEDLVENIANTSQDGVEKTRGTRH